jgi:hypothetical protein
VLQVDDPALELPRFLGAMAEDRAGADQAQPMGPLHDNRDLRVLDVQNVDPLPPQMLDQAPGERGLLDPVSAAESKPPEKPLRQAPQQALRKDGIALPAGQDLLEVGLRGSAALAQRHVDFPSRQGRAQIGRPGLDSTGNVAQTAGSNADSHRVMRSVSDGMVV